MKGESTIKKKYIKILVLVLIVFFVLCYLMIPSFRDSLKNMFVVFSDQEKMKKFIASYGVYAAFISFLLMIFQSIAAPLPAFIITLTNAALFGWVYGAILSWTSAMVGAALCFYLAKLFGRDFVIKFTSEKLLNDTDKFFEKYGTKTVLITRLLPFVSFDIISYAAGLTSMKFRNFIIATGIGQLPATIIYSYVGRQLTGGAQKLFIGLLVLFSLVIIISIIRQIYVSRTKINV